MCENKKGIIEFMCVGWHMNFNLNIFFTKLRNLLCTRPTYSMDANIINL